MSQKINYGRHSIDENDIKAVSDVLRYSAITQGEQSKKFEDALSKFVEVDDTAVVNSATSALHLTLMALEINEKSLVWTSPISFVTSSNVALYCGAKIDFVDIDLKTGNICPDALLKKILYSIKNFKKPDLLIIVHYAGTPCDFEKIFEVCATYNIKIIEDASHALGASYNNNKIGKCEFSEACVFSFHPVKMITTGEGGAVTSNNRALINKIKTLREHGLIRNVSVNNSNYEPWEYDQAYLGYNFRITDFQCALGLSQLKKLKSFVSERNRIVKVYKNNLKNLPLTFQKIDSKLISSFHLLIVKLENSAIRKQLWSHLNKNNILVGVHYRPIYLNSFYIKMGFSSGYCVNAEKFYSQVLSLPIHLNLTECDIEKVCALIKDFFK